MSGSRESVSVCIPAFNEERLIRRCLESVSAQQGVLIEEILVGINSSTDRTRAIVEDYAKVDERVRVVDSPKGKAHAWNALNRVARNNLRFFQDGDCLATSDSYLQLLKDLGTHKIVGAAIERDVRGRSLIIRILNFPRRFFSPYGQLNGGLYLMVYDEVVISLEKEVGRGLMPVDMVNDDLFLHLVCGNVFVSKKVYILIECAETIKDEIGRWRRMKYGNALICEKYPKIFSRLPKRGIMMDMLGAVALFNYATPLEKVLYPFVVILKFLLFKYIDIKSSGSFPIEPVKWK